MRTGGVGLDDGLGRDADAAVVEGQLAALEAVGPAVVVAPHDGLASAPGALAHRLARLDGLVLEVDGADGRVHGAQEEQQVGAAARPCGRKPPHTLPTPSENTLARVDRRSQRLKSNFARVTVSLDPLLFHSAFWFETNTDSPTADSERRKSKQTFSSGQKSRGGLPLKWQQKAKWPHLDIWPFLLDANNVV